MPQRFHLCSIRTRLAIWALGLMAFTIGLQILGGISVRPLDFPRSGGPLRVYLCQQSACFATNAAYLLPINLLEDFSKPLSLSSGQADFHAGSFRAASKPRRRFLEVLPHGPRAGSCRAASKPRSLSAQGNPSFGGLAPGKVHGFHVLELVTFSRNRAFTIQTLPGPRPLCPRYAGLAE